MNEYADSFQDEKAHSPTRVLQAHWTHEDFAELRVPAPNEYVNFKKKTDNGLGIQSEPLAATRKLNAPEAAASSPRPGDSK